MKTLKRSLFRDILRDTDSRKFSMTKFGALITLILLTIAVGASIWIMIQSKKIDYVLIGELITLLLTLLGFKTEKEKIKSDNIKTEQVMKDSLNDTNEKDTLN
jgi:heme/copper-type cytochrome/quinol oxidase subunit 4